MHCAGDYDFAMCWRLSMQCAGDFDAMLEIMMHCAGDYDALRWRL